MTTNTILSVTLSVDLVKRLIQDHLNANVLRCPHTITDLDLVAETDTVVVTLEPLITRRTPAGDWQPITVEELARDLVEAPTNGNGNGHPADADLVGADLGVRPDVVPAPTPEVTPAEAPKRRSVTPEQDAEILRLHAEGWSQQKISAELNINKSTVNYRIERARQANGAA